MKRLHLPIAASMMMLTTSLFATYEDESRDFPRRGRHNPYVVALKLADFAGSIRAHRYDIRRAAKRIERSALRVARILRHEDGRRDDHRRRDGYYRDFGHDFGFSHHRRHGRRLKYAMHRLRRVADNFHEVAPYYLSRKVDRLMRHLHRALHRGSHRGPIDRHRGPIDRHRGPIFGG